MTGWQGSNRARRLPLNWQTIRLRILNRDGWRCTWTDKGERCTAQATDVDHIVPGDDHSDANLRSLCGYHHGRKSAAEGVLARNMHLRKRPQPPHPGLRPPGG